MGPPRIPICYVTGGVINTTTVQQESQVVTPRTGDRCSGGRATKAHTPTLKRVAP